MQVNEKAIELGTLFLRVCLRIRVLVVIRISLSPLPSYLGPLSLHSFTLITLLCFVGRALSRSSRWLSLLTHCDSGAPRLLSYHPCRNCQLPIAAHLPVLRINLTLTTLHLRRQLNSTRSSSFFNLSCPSVFHHQSAVSARLVQDEFGHSDKYRNLEWFGL